MVQLLWPVCARPSTCGPLEAIHVDAAASKIIQPRWMCLMFLAVSGAKKVGEGPSTGPGIVARLRNRTTTAPVRELFVLSSIIDHNLYDSA